MRRALGIICLLVGLLTAAGGYYAYRFHGDLASATVLVAFGLLMIPYFALGFDSIIDALRTMGRSNRFRLAAMGFLLLAPGTLMMAIAADSASFLHNMLVLALYVTVPIIILAGLGGGQSRPTALDLLALLALWLPVELQYFERLWLLPDGNPSYVLAKTLGMELAVFCFVVVRRLDGVGYRFRLAGEDFTIGFVALIVFLAVGIPTALGTGFVEFEPSWSGLGNWLLMSLAIFFFIALPEEVLFRGLIFNMLQRYIKVGGPYTALVISSFIFGLAHLNNPPGDWRYVILATAAGMCYGWAYLRSGSLLAAAYAHAMVDIIGRTIFPHPS